MIQRKKEEIGRGEGGERRSGTGVRHMKNQVRKDGQVPRKAMLRGIETVKDIQVILIVSIDPRHAAAGET